MQRLPVHCGHNLPREARLLLNCDRAPWGRGLCRSHYIQFAQRAIWDPVRESYKGFLTPLGSPDAPSVRLHLPLASPVCEDPHCLRASRALGYCHVHYQQYKRTGSTGPVRVAELVSCEIEGCSREAQTHRLCVSHYRREGRDRPLGPLLARSGGAQQDHACAHPGCVHRALTKGLCRAHYRQQSRNTVLRDLRPAQRVISFYR